MKTKHFGFTLSMARMSSIAISVLALSIHGNAQTYRITDLGTNVWANAINNAGIIGADFNLTGGGYHACVYTNGLTVDLGSLGEVSSHSSDINDLGQVTGFFGNSVVADEGNIKKPFLYTGGLMQDLSSIIVASTVWPYAINNSGQVVGWLIDPNTGHQRSFLYSGGSMQDLGFDGVAYDINDAGKIVGHEYVAGGNQAYLLSGGLRTPLGTLGGNDTSAIRINNNGLIAGNSQLLNGSYHAFVRTGGQIHDLGTLGGASSGVHGLNNSGLIVGSSDTSGGAVHAYLYRNGEILDLNDLIPQNTGWTLSYAMDINDNGLIVGGGKKDGVTRAFLLIPNATNAPFSNQAAILILGGGEAGLRGKWAEKCRAEGGRHQIVAIVTQL